MIRRTCTCCLLSGAEIRLAPGGQLQSLSANASNGSRTVVDLSWWPDERVLEVLNREAITYGPEERENWRKALAMRTRPPWATVRAATAASLHDFVEAVQRLATGAPAPVDVSVSPDGAIGSIERTGLALARVSSGKLSQGQQSLTAMLLTDDKDTVLSVLGALKSLGVDSVDVDTPQWTQEQCDLITDLASLEVVLETLGVETPLPESQTWCGLHRRNYDPTWGFPDTAFTVNF